MRLLHHVALGARDVEKVAAFYREVMGLPEQTRHFHDDGRLRSIWLDLGGETTLMVEPTDRPPQSIQGIDVGPFLLAFRVSRDEHRAMEERLENAGARIEGRTQFSSYARDPEGNRIAISHHPLMGGG